MLFLVAAGSEKYYQSTIAESQVRVGRATMKKLNSFNIHPRWRIYVKYGGPNDPHEPGDQVKFERLPRLRIDFDPSSRLTFVHRRR